uniref:BPTI/Kunitz inhibitor domain-containing protein n=1 Tax=Naja naja TaxID=35670 RepID=A0A8C6Y6X2_NAJNA
MDTYKPEFTARGISKFLIGFSDICLLPKQEGDCTALFLHWFHNWRSGRCELFIYGGCGGNANNFETREECQRTCVPSEPPQIPAQTHSLQPSLTHIKI